MKNRSLLLLICCLSGVPSLFSQVNLISEGGSTNCTGLLYDTGGPDGDYGPDEDFTYVICPTGNPSCVEFTFEFYDLENENLSDALRIFDGDVNGGSATEIVVLGGEAGLAGDVGDVTGAVCFRTFATSGCVSVQFQSDSDGERSGFSAAWNCAPAACNTARPISVDTSVNATTIAEAIRGPGTVISNVTLTCPNGAYGVFNGAGSDLGLETGVLLTTGRAAGAIGPNVTGDLGEFGSPSGPSPGDLDLDALGTLLGETAASQDACVLELDVIVDTDELIFDYTFGSDEYPEFVDNEVNDIFAFFISGPGIDGEVELNNQRNIAILPNGRGTVVQIDSINSASNNEYYRNNSLGQSVDYDGLTAGFRGEPKTLRARADVTACESYHLKLAIADRGDDAYDSGVFIAGLCGGLPDVDISMASGIDYLVEDCLDQSDSIRIVFNNVKEVAQTYALQTGGTAVLNQDYILPGLPTNIVFQPGRTVLTFPVVIIGDGEDEGEENITFSFVADFGCDTEVDITSISIPLRDNAEVTLETSNGGETVFFCAGSTFELTASGATDYTWTTDVGPIIATGDTSLVTPANDGQVTLVGSVGNCTDTVRFNVEAIATEVEILNPDTINVCQGDTVQLMQTNNTDDQGIVWLTTAGFLDNATTPNPRVIPQFSRYYVVSAGPDGGCGAKDSVYIDVDVFVVPELISDTLLCQGYPIMLIQGDSIQDTGNTTYNWSPGSFLTDSTDVNAVYDPNLFIDTVFTLISAVENGACADTQEVRIELIQSSLSIFGNDTITACLGETEIVLEASVNPGANGTIRWFPSTGALSGNNDRTYRVEPLSDIKYYVEATVNGCYQIDSVTVRIDSLPDMPMTLEPIKDPYCQGDTFYIRSPTYDPGDFPLITHSWDVAPGLASPDDLYNGVFFAQDSIMMMRTTENGACRTVDSIQVNVIKPPILIFDPVDPMVCPGDPLQITVTFGEGGPRGELEWEDPNNTLSCDDCLDPVATVSGPTTYTIEVTAEGSDCSMPVMYSIGIIEDTPPTLTNQTNICSGDSRQIIDGGIVPGYTYRITGGGIDSTDPRLIVTPPANNTTYTVTTTGDCGTFTDMVTFTFRDVYTLTASGPGSICLGDNATLRAQLSNETRGEFIWRNAAGVIVGEGVQIDVRPEEQTTYTVTFTESAGGCGTSATADVTVDVFGGNIFPEIIAISSNGTELMENDTIFSGTQVTLSVIGIPAGLDVNIQWSGNYDPSTGTGESLLVNVPDDGPNGSDLNYTVTVSATGADCPVSQSISLNYISTEARFPGVITPNGDGTNDFFRLFTAGTVTDYTLLIFNRWGQKVFESTDPMEDWDGTKNGTPQNMDTYLYVAKYRLNGAEKEEDGQFSLIR